MHKKKVGGDGPANPPKHHPNPAHLKHTKEEAAK